MNWDAYIPGFAGRTANFSPLEKNGLTKRNPLLGQGTRFFCQTSSGKVLVIIILEDPACCPTDASNESNRLILIDALQGSGWPSFNVRLIPESENRTALYLALLD